VIPRIIHQIWIGPDDRPKIWMDTYASDYMRRFPAWTYMLWTEEEIDAFGLENREFYEREPSYAVKSDIVRVELLCRYGGIYVDADSVWVNDKDYGDLIEQARDTGMFVGVEPDLGFGRIYAGGVMGSVPGHRPCRQSTWSGRAPVTVESSRSAGNRVPSIP
jgi:mannosyltransferase OCH1-like enzyme